MTNFIVGRDNLSMTVFVPYDCGFNCPFCTTKKEYKDITEDELPMRMLRIKDSIKELIYNDDIKDVVITGGEPMSRVDLLSELLDVVPRNKNVYINTTLPKTTSAEKLIEDVQMLAGRFRHLKGFNVSRHFVNLFRDLNHDDSVIIKVNKIIPVRINCVIMNNEQITETNVKNIINRFNGDIPISFRADYRKITQETLKSIDEPGFRKFYDIADKYLGSGGCMVCFDDRFTLMSDTGNVGKFSYHRSIERSAVVLGDDIFVNDIIVKQDGSVRYDWDGVVNTPLNEAFLVDFKRRSKDAQLKEKEKKTKVPREVIVTGPIGENRCGTFNSGRRWGLPGVCGGSSCGSSGRCG